MARQSVNRGHKLMHGTDDDDFEDFDMCPTKSNHSDGRSKHANKSVIYIQENTPSRVTSSKVKVDNLSESARNPKINKRSRQNDKVKNTLKKIVTDVKGKAISLDSSSDGSDSNSPVKKRKKVSCGPSSYSMKKQLFKVKKRAIKSVKVDDIPCIDVEPLALYFRPDQHRSRRICTHTAADAVQVIKKTLDETQLKMFRQSCFGHFLDMPKFVTCNKLLNAILMREICPPPDDSDALWFKFYGKNFRFGLMEFGLITGMKCIGNHRKEYYSLEKNRLLKLYFGGASRVTKSLLVECFTKKKWENDEDAIKLAALFFIHTFLFSTKNSKGTDTIIKEKDFNLVECGAWQSFPWGTKVFTATKNSMHDKLRPYKTCYRFGGLPYALQAWFYEISPTVHGNIAYRVANTSPRILNWHVKRSYGFEELQQGFFSFKKGEITFTPVVPTEEELSTIQLPQSTSVDVDVDIAVETPQDQPTEEHQEAPNGYEGSHRTCNQVHHVPSPDIQLLFDQQKLMHKDMTGFKKYTVTCFEKIFNKLDIPSDNTEGFNDFTGVPRADHGEHESLKDVDPVHMENDENDQRCYNDLFNEHVEGIQQVNDDMGAKTNVFQSDVGSAGFKECVFMGDIDDAFRFADIDFTNSSVTVAKSIPFDATFNGGDIPRDKGDITFNDEGENGHDKGKQQINDFQGAKLNAEQADLDKGNKDIGKDVMFMDSGNNGETSFNEGKGPANDLGSDLDWGLPTPDLHESQWHQLEAKALEEVMSKAKGQDQVPPKQNVNNSVDVVQQHQYRGNLDDLVDEVMTIQPVVTPQVHPLTRKPGRTRKPGKFKKSPFINDFGSSSHNSQLAKRRTFRLFHPFIDEIRNEPAYSLVCKFSHWIDYKAIAKSKKGDVYPACENKLNPKFNFGVHLVDKKDWFHLLNYGYKPLSTSHLDVLFYYLRKKARYDGDIDVRVTTTDCMFDTTIRGVYENFIRNDQQKSVVDSTTVIRDYIFGSRLRCNTPWVFVDEVLFPVMVVHDWHWILVRMSFKDRVLYVYDSRPSLPAYNEEVIQAVDAYATIIPIYLAATDFYNKRPELFYKYSPYEDKALTEPFRMDFSIEVPSLNIRDYSLYAAVFAEYYIQYQCMPNEDDDLSFVRDRYTMYLWDYGSSKIIDCACSDEEN